MLRSARRSHEEHSGAVSCCPNGRQQGPTLAESKTVDHANQDELLPDGNEPLPEEP